MVCRFYSYLCNLSSNICFCLFEKDVNLIESLNNPDGGKFRIIHTKELALDYKYSVTELFIMNTKYGKKVVATIGNFPGEVGDAKYFLPPKYSLIVKRWAKNPEDIDCTGLNMVVTGYRRDRYKSALLKFIVEYESDSESDVNNEN